MSIFKLKNTILNNMTKSEEIGVDLDNILVELGQFGKYQVINYGFILIPIIFSSIYNGQYVFNAASVSYRYLFYFYYYTYIIIYLLSQGRYINSGTIIRNSKKYFRIFVLNL